MTPHLTVERLSTYLDEELPRGRRRQVESHLEQCDHCRERLHGLQKVVRDLGALERLAPPPHLGFRVHRFVALQPSQPTLMERLESSASRLNLQGALLPLFAVVTALVLIIYLLSWGVAHRQQEDAPVLVYPESFAAEERVSLPEVGSIVKTGGRTLSYLNGVWVEEGLEFATDFKEMKAGQPDTVRLLERHPRLEKLSALGAPVRLRVDDELVEIDFAR